MEKVRRGVGGGEERMLWKREEMEPKKGWKMG